MAQIICKDLSLGYDGRTICEGINFEINAGDYVCIVGDNGSGKSTLVKTLLSLKSASGGEMIFGEGLTRKDVGYLPQQSEVQRDFPASVREVVISGCVGALGKKAFFGRSERLEAEQNMKIMGIHELADKSYRALSGGQQQRVLLARALCAAKKVILLDEPVSGLDPSAAASLYSLIHHLNRHMGVTVIMVTHDLDNALRDANRVLRMGARPEFFSEVDLYREKYLTGGAQ
jgi:zinc transport system ATP-binding protein